MFLSLCSLKVKNGSGGNGEGEGEGEKVLICSLFFPSILTSALFTICINTLCTAQCSGALYNLFSFCSLGLF